MVLFLLVLLQIAPLSDEHRTALDTARDGGDHREAAFVALVEHVSSWPERPGDVAIRISPDLAALVAAPADARGDLCMLRGELQQHVRLASPHDGVIECFLRIDDGSPLILYVHAPSVLPAWARDGAALEVPARFYKSVTAVARDGETRTYPAFVGAHPVLTESAAPSAGAPPGLLAGLVVLGLVFGALLLYTRRQRAASAATGRAPRRPSLGELDAGAALPEDAAEALGELRKRSERG